MKVIGVRFRRNGKICFFNPGEHEINIGNHVIVETQKGMEIGAVVVKNDIEPKGISEEIKPIIRVANKKDLERKQLNEANIEKILKETKELVKNHKLSMKLLDCEYTFDQSKLLFYFTAEGRIDFRDLVKDLAAKYRVRIELRQVGPRDEIRLFGSNGMCGKELCCNTFLNDFEPVVIKMAKDQGTQLNPAKISGVCGRLMCCLKYEQSVYDEKLKRLPKYGSLVNTPEGRGYIENIEVLKEKVRVRVGNSEESRAHVFDFKDIEVIRNGKGGVKDGIQD